MRIKRKQYICWAAIFLSLSLLSGLFYPEAGKKAGAAELSREGENTIQGICVINGSDVSALDARISVRYKSRCINISPNPVVEYREILWMALRETICRRGPKVQYEYSEKTGRVRLVWQNHVMTFYIGEKTMYADGRRYTLPAAPARVVYTGSGREDILVPMEQICMALGFVCSWNEDHTVYSLEKQSVRFRGTKSRTGYPYSMKKYARAEYKRSRKASYKTFIKLVSISGDTTEGFKYMRIDRYRDVNKAKFKQYYQYLIRDYCRENKINPRKSSLYNKAEVFLKAARKYRLDPVYLVSQTFLESAFGTSLLAKGNRISKVTYRNYACGRNGRFKTKKLRKKYKVYNLYGVKAYDVDPYVGGTSYAYYHQWTTVNRAIYGAARYISSNYIHSKYEQNTIFKMRFAPRGRNMWHQYATDPCYAEKIGLRMYLMSTCYAENAVFAYDYPAYK